MQTRMTAAPLKCSTRDTSASVMQRNLGFISSVRARLGSEPEHCIREIKSPGFFALQNATFMPPARFSRMVRVAKSRTKHPPPAPNSADLLTQSCLTECPADTEDLHRLIYLPIPTSATATTTTTSSSSAIVPVEPPPRAILGQLHHVGSSLSSNQACGFL